MKISVIVAISDNNAIGKYNKMLWYLPNDFKMFKEKTVGHHIIMGRKTFESIGKPLPNRTSIIITRQKDYVAEGCLVAHSLEEALQWVHPEETEVFIIGGSEIYNLSMEIADCLYVTQVNGTFKADAYFPIISNTIWDLRTRQLHSFDEKHKYNYTFNTYTRKK